MSKHTNDTQISYSLLTKDYQELLDFVYPIDANEGTYSHRIYEIYLRTATEFENVCKQQLVLDGYNKKPKDMKIGDYQTLDNKLNLSSLEVGLLFWNPVIKHIKPFGDWKTGAELKWYSDYNKVKHNRAENFEKANFLNLTMGLAGLFLVSYKLFGRSFFNQYQTMISSSGKSSGGVTETFFPNSPFSVRK